MCGRSNGVRRILRTVKLLSVIAVETMSETIEAMLEIE
jgi:hypothetical protein